jgi:N-acetylmuramoyl-L-alanine amidase
MKWTAALCVLMPLACEAQDWASLTHADGCLTRGEFIRLVEQVYSPDMGLYAYTTFASNGVALHASTNRDGAPLVSIRFADSETQRAVAPRTFKTRADIAALGNPADAPLRGLRICLDPGHIGGAWARMEERFLVIDRTQWFVQEAAMNLLVARLAREQLEKLGAAVLMTKDDFEPVTTNRPPDFQAQAEIDVGAYERFGHLPDLFREAARQDGIRKRAELLFYRNAEIAARAKKVNEELKPDITACIHFNATEQSGDDKMTDANGLMVFTHGNYSASELESPDQRFFLMRKLLEGSHETELGAAEAVCTALRDATGLDIVQFYEGGFAGPAGTNGLVYARNLAASRQFAGPVIYLEPYYMNNRTVYRRIQLGDYDGVKEIDGTPFRSIFREYADAIVAGLLAYYAPSTPQ